MAKEILFVEQGSPAQKAGIQGLDRLISVNGHQIKDVLDYKFYTYDSPLNIKIRRDQAELSFVIEKEEGADIGLGFDSYLMDEQKGCSNKCVFCFIDQLPKNMRKTLYFKDDDARLSFLVGNYITLTNLSDEDTQRIIKMNVSPLNISVHTLNPELRSLMLGSKRGGDSLRHLYAFAKAGLKINTQIVVCPGLNDGAELESTLRGLSALQPSVQSVAAVPVGLTRFRDGLYPLTPMNAASAAQTIEIIDSIRGENTRLYGKNICYAADELYLKAETPLPPADYYDDFAQLENGVGLMAMFEAELKGALGAEDDFAPPPAFGVVCGMAAAGFIRAMIDTVREKCHNLEYKIFPVVNGFFGPTVDVSGLVTGSDIIAALKDKRLPQKIFIPQSMLRHKENVFLDDITLEKLNERLNCTFVPIEVDGGSFLDAILAL